MCCVCCLCRVLPTCMCLLLHLLNRKGSTIRLVHRLLPPRVGAVVFVRDGSRVSFGVISLFSSLQVRGRALKPALCRLHREVPPALTMWWLVVAFPPSQDGTCMVALLSCRPFGGGSWVLDSALVTRSLNKKQPPPPPKKATPRTLPLGNFMASISLPQCKLCMHPWNAAKIKASRRRMAPVGLHRCLFCSV